MRREQVPITSKFDKGVTNLPKMETPANLDLQKLTQFYDKGVEILKMKNASIGIMKELLELDPQGQDALSWQRNKHEARAEILHLKLFSPILQDKIEQVKVRISIIIMNILWL